MGTKLYSGKHRCHVEKNVLIVSILPSRWRDGAESLRIETTSCFAVVKLNSIKEQLRAMVVAQLVECVASDVRGLGLESSHRQDFIIYC